jgi:3-dehydroquinate dehydratase type I
MAAENNFPLIAFCMGAIGKISRLATIKLGGYMTYAAPDEGKETAPGQMPVSVLRDMLSRL